MPVDINLLRKNPEIVIQSQKRRFKSVDLVHEVIDLDNQHNKKLVLLEQTRKESNKISKTFRDLDEAGKERAKVEVSRLKKIAEELEKEVNQLKIERDNRLNLIGNIIDNDVPISKDENDNEVIEMFNVKREFGLKPLPHYDVMAKIEGANMEAGSKIAGHRGYFLRNDLVQLNLALQMYSLNFLADLDYELLQTPFFMKKEVMAKTAQLEDFDDQLFNIGETDNYLCATVWYIVPHDFL